MVKNKNRRGGEEEENEGEERGWGEGGGEGGGWSRLGPCLVLSVQVLEFEKCARLMMNVCVT